MPEIDWTKPLQTEDGRPARLICRDREDGCAGEQTYGVYVYDGFTEKHAIVAAATGIGILEQSGKATCIVNAPPPEPRQVEREGWVVFNDIGRIVTGPHDSEAIIRDAWSPRLLNEGFSIARITWTEPAPEPEKPAERWMVYACRRSGHIDHCIKASRADAERAALTYAREDGWTAEIARLELVDPARAPGDGDGGA